MASSNLEARQDRLNTLRPTQPLMAHRSAPPAPPTAATAKRSAARMRARLAGLKVSAAAISVLAAIVLFPGRASATWSIVGVDPETGEVGVAIASCTDYEALGIRQAEVVPAITLVPGMGAGISIGVDMPRSTQGMIDLMPPLPPSSTTLQNPGQQTEQGDPPASLPKTADRPSLPGVQSDSGPTSTTTGVSGQDDEQPTTSASTRETRPATQTPAQQGASDTQAKQGLSPKPTSSKMVSVARPGGAPPEAGGPSMTTIPLGQLPEPGVAEPDTAAFRTVLSIRDRQTPEEVLSSLIDPDFAPDAATQQHAIVTVNGSAAAFTGSANPEVSIDAQSTNVSVQGIAVSDSAVVTEALNEYRNQESAGVPLSERLSQALLAGSGAGGDVACNEQTAKFAQVVVAKPDDRQKPSILATSVAAGANENPVESIQDKVTNATRLASDGKGRLILGASGFALILGGMLFVALRSNKSTVSIPEGMRTAADDTGPRPIPMSQEDPVVLLQDLGDLVEGPPPSDSWLSDLKRPDQPE